MNFDMDRMMVGMEELELGRRRGNDINTAHIYKI